MAGEIIRSFRELTGTGGERLFLVLKPLVALKIFCNVFSEAFREASEMVLVGSAGPDSVL